MHTIRLRAAWTVEGALATRRFNRPTGLGSDTVVWLMWDGEATDAKLNGGSLPAGGDRHDVTARLEPSNVIELTDSPAELRSTVRLEIRAGAPKQATEAV